MSEVSALRNPVAADSCAVAFAAAAFARAWEAARWRAERAEYPFVADIVGNTPDQFATQIKAEYDVYKQVVEKQKLKLD